MDFGEEITQLLVIIVGLLVALFGLNFWVKRGGGINMPSTKSNSQNVQQYVEDVDQDAEEKMADLKLPKTGKDRHGDRFDLTGKDAEAAARVLKRMLKQDSSQNDNA